MLADLAAGEIGDGVVGGFFEQQIAEGAEKRQAAARPGFLVLLLALCSGLASSAGWVLNGK